MEKEQRRLLAAPESKRWPVNLDPNTSSNIVDIFKRAHRSMGIMDNKVLPGPQHAELMKRVALEIGKLPILPSQKTESQMAFAKTPIIQERKSLIQRGATIFRAIRIPRINLPRLTNF